MEALAQELSDLKAEAVVLKRQTIAEPDRNVLLTSLAALNNRIAALENHITVLENQKSRGTFSFSSS